MKSQPSQRARSGAVSQQLTTLLSHLKLNCCAQFPRANLSQRTGEQGDYRSLPSPTPLIPGHSASNGACFARAAPEIRPVLLALCTKPVSFPKRKQYSCYSRFPSSDSQVAKCKSEIYETDAAEQRRVTKRLSDATSNII